MDDDTKGKTSTPWSIPSWRRIGDFFLVIFRLEESYQSLKAKNDRLNEDLDRLQRQVDEHSGQLKVLLTFVQASLEKQVEMSAEKAAARHLERLIALKINPPDGSR